MMTGSQKRLNSSKEILGLTEKEYIYRGKIGLVPLKYLNLGQVTPEYAYTIC